MKLCSEGAKKVLKDKSSVLRGFLDESGVMEIINHPEEISSPWYRCV